MWILLLYSSHVRKGRNNPMQIRASNNICHSTAACGFYQVRNRRSLDAWVHSNMENQFMHSFKENNSCIIALVRGQATASIAFISPKWGCIWFQCLWDYIDSCTYLCQTLQWMLNLHQTFEHSQFVQGWLSSMLHLRNPFLLLSICSFINSDCHCFHMHKCMDFFLE